MLLLNHYPSGSQHISFSPIPGTGIPKTVTPRNISKPASKHSSSASKEYLLAPLSFSQAHLTWRLGSRLVYFHFVFLSWVFNENFILPFLCFTWPFSSQLCQSWPYRCDSQCTIRIEILLVNDRYIPMITHHRYYHTRSSPLRTYKLLSSSSLFRD